MNSEQTSNVNTFIVIMLFLIAFGAPAYSLWLGIDAFDIISFKFLIYMLVSGPALSIITKVNGFLAKRASLLSFVNQIGAIIVGVMFGLINLIIVHYLMPFIIENVR